MLRSAFATLAFVLLAAPAAFGEPQRYALDPSHTQVGWSIDRFGFTHILGRFDQTEGVVMLDRENPANSSVTADITIASVSAGDPTRDEHLREERWLNAAAHPTMSFRSTSVTLTGETTATVVGDLTLRGVTAPVTLSVTLNKLGQNPTNQREAAGFTATGTLSRAAFGIAIAPGLIGDEVAITIETLAYLAPPTEAPAE